MYGVFREPDGYSERAIFVIDKRGYIRYIDIHDIDHQPDNDVVLEVLRRIDPEAALRSPAPPPIKPEDVQITTWGSGDVLHPLVPRLPQSTCLVPGE